MPFRTSPFVVIFLIVCSLGLAARATDQLTYHNDNQSTGVNPNETQISPSITVNTFAKRFATLVDGQVYAQPLYKAGVNVVSGPNAGTHDLVFVATQHDSLYAIDAASGAVVWQTSFLGSGLAGATTITPMPQADSGSTDITVEIGVCGTPVIDPATNFLYAAAKTKQIVNSDTANPHYVYTLYKIDITNGNPTANANIAASLVIADTVNVNGASATYLHRTNVDPLAVQDPFSVGTGYTGEAVSLGGQSRVYFNAQREMNRPGMVLTGGRLYIAFASHGDNGPYHGWLLSFDKTTLALTGALNTTPNGGLGGIWQGGGIPSVDAAGNFYFETGNGSFNSNTASGTFPTDGNYGDCFVKVSLDPTTTPASQNKNGWGLKVADYFSPFNNAALNSVDRDLGSGGCLILPDSAGNATHPHLLIGAGKEGKIYLIDRDNMGKFDSTTDRVVQTEGYSSGVPNTGINGSLGTPAFFNGTLYYVGGYGDFGKTFLISNAAFSTAAVQETPDSFAFPGSTPSISANGTLNGVAWTLERGTNQLRAYAASNFNQEIWTSAQAGTRDAIGSVVKFSVPTVADGRVFAGTNNSLVCYGPPIPPTAPPAAPTGLTATPQSGIQIDLDWIDNATNEDGFKVEQSSDGVNFTEIASVGVNAIAYSVTGLQVSTPYYFRIRAYNSFNTLSYSSYSNVTSAVTDGITPTLDFSAGFASAAPLLNFVGGSSISGTRLRVTDGTSNEARAVWTKNAQNIAKFSTQFSFQIVAGIGFADGFTFCIQRAGNSVVGLPGSDLGYRTIPTSVALKFDVYPNVSTTGLYFNGLAPNNNPPASIDMLSSGIDLHSGRVFGVTLSYDGTTLTERVSDNTTGAVFTHQYTGSLVNALGSSTAFLGFTGGTGGETTTQDILTWSYSIPPSSAPVAPSALNAAPASGTQVNLSWTDNADNEAGFKVERKLGADGSYAQIGVTGANLLTFNDSGLVGGTDYYYRVRATNSVGDSGYTDEAHAFTPVPPVTPTGATTTLVTSTRINLAWTDNADNETGYKVLRKAGLAATFFEIAALPANATSYNDANLSPGVTYDYHIQAYNLAGYSDFAGETVQTLPRISLAATDASAQEGTADTATFTISRLGETDDALPVAFTVATGASEAGPGIRYTLSTASPVTIPDGASSATITVTPLSDPAVLGTQNVTLTLGADEDYEITAPTSAAISLLDSPVNAWKITEFGSVAAAQAPAAADTATPAGDDLPNLEKYALGLHALTAYPPTTAGLPAVTFLPPTSTRLALSVRRPRPAPAGVTYFIEATGDLIGGSWTPLPYENGYPLDNGDGTETLKADDTQTTGTATTRFLRLRITRP